MVLVLVLMCISLMSSDTGPRMPSARLCVVFGEMPSRPVLTSELGFGC